MPTERHHQAAPEGKAATPVAARERRAAKLLTPEGRILYAQRKVNEADAERPGNSEENP